MHAFRSGKVLLQLYQLLEVVAKLVKERYNLFLDYVHHKGPFSVENTGCKLIVFIYNSGK